MFQSRKSKTRQVLRESQLQSKFKVWSDCVRKLRAWPCVLVNAASN